MTVINYTEEVSNSEAVCKHITEAKI